MPHDVALGAHSQEQVSSPIEPTVELAPWERRVDLSTNDHQQGSFLLRLAPEVRNTIFEMVFKDTTIVYPKPTGLFNDFTELPKAPALVLICKKVNEEAFKLFYANVTFAFECPSSYVNWQRIIPLQLQSLVGLKVLYIPMYKYHSFCREANQGVIRTITDAKLRYETRLALGSFYQRSTTSKESSSLNKISDILTARLVFLRRLEFGSHERHQDWTPVWPVVLLPVGLRQHNTGPCIEHTNAMALRKSNNRVISDVAVEQVPCATFILRMG
jgi:hypothetical protein